MTTHTRSWRRAALTLALFAAAALAASSCQRANAPTAAYHCPMHPTYVSDRPGDCPICGMRLVPIESTGSGHASPAGATTPATGASAEQPPAGTTRQPGRAGAATYTCPMHPKVVADQPGRCPECGMDLVPTSAETPPATPSSPGAGATAHAAHDPGSASAPPGMAPVSLGAEAHQLAGVVAEAVARETMSRTIRTVGSVVADESRIRHVHTKVSGWVERLSVTFTGQRVRQGEPLLALYSPELLASQEEYLRARDAAVRFAASAIPEVRRGGLDLVAAARRRLDLFDVPPEFIATLERSGTPSRTVPLLSPSSGFVTAKATYEGHRVEPGMELFTITDLSHVWIEGDFYEFDASVVREGQRARLGLPYDSRPPLSARVSYIYPSLNLEARTLRVRFETPNPSLALKPGMFVNIELETGRQTALTIPDSAVLDTGERQVVFVDVGDGRFDPREVRIGARTGGRAQVLAGLDEGERVVVRANFLLDSESRLRAALAGSRPPTPAPRAPGAKKGPGGARP